VAAGIAIVFLGRRNWKIGAWVVPVVYTVVASLEAIVAGSVVGGLLGGVYNAGFYRMSTWIPFVWGLINTVVLVLSSFAISSGL
jgi:Putative transmembrane protein 170